MGYIVHRETIPEATQEETPEWHQVDAPAGSYVVSAFTSDITPGDIPGFTSGRELFLDGSNRVTGMEFARNPYRDIYGYVICVTGDLSGTVALTAGVATVSTSAVTANSRIFLQRHTAAGTTVGNVYEVTARTAGTSFTVTAVILATGLTGVLDTSTVAWHIVEP